ncbi:MAG: PAS domain-containing protein [Ruminococcaceae bacterium]|nr:PAS domain-containing protein [Oscillospiraceae bacterium]
MAEWLKLKKSNCKNCYKCIRHCPVKSIRFSGNQAHIVSNECILCGHCFVVCPQNAKEITDETEIVKVLLSGDDPVIASLAPSFIANYGVGIESMRAALKRLGFADVEETAQGATMVKNEYNRILQEEKRDVLISSCCHSVNLLIQKHFPSVLPYLAGTVSPMQAHCMDIKKRYPNAKTVFIGPCLAKKDEADYYSGITDAVLTFEELTAWLAEEHIELEQTIDDVKESRARLFPTTGGILQTMGERIPGYTYLAVDGTQNCIAVLKDIEEGRIHNAFIEMSACVGSCISGPVMEKKSYSHLKEQSMVSDYAGEDDFVVDQPEKLALYKNIEPILKKLHRPGEEEIRAVLKNMGKTKPEDELNCGSCGYDTCREKAIAIYQGKAEISMCLPFLKDKAESFSDNIVNNTPNGIIVVNEQLEVQLINNSAKRLLNLRDVTDVLGEPVVRIMDPVDFVHVLSSGERQSAKRVYMAEYDRYMEQTIIPDKDYHVMICMLRDVTEEENSRKKKENISAQTIDVADKVVDRQMRIVQEIASLLGETAAETKIALTKLKETIANE